MKSIYLLASTIMGAFMVSSGLGIAPNRRRGRLPTSMLHRDSSSLFLGPNVIDKIRGGSTGLETVSSLKSTTDASSRGGAAEPPMSRRGLDFVALAKYSVGMGVQLSIIYGIFMAIDRAVAKSALKVPLWVNSIFFYLFNVKTSSFSPLKQQREEKTEDEEEKRTFVKPSWTPPGIAFAIMWPLFVFGIRAVTAAMIVAESGGIFATPTLMYLFGSLGFGTFWNTVNNVERRLGFSVPVLYGLLISNLYASYRFYLIKPLAGKLLAATSTWLAAAAALETHTWLLNPDPDTGHPEPLYPAKDRRWKSKFRWEQ